MHIVGCWRHCGWRTMLSAISQQPKTWYANIFMIPWCQGLIHYITFVLLVDCKLVRCNCHRSQSLIWHPTASRTAKTASICEDLTRLTWCQGIKSCRCSKIGFLGLRLILNVKTRQNSPNPRYCVRISWPHLVPPSMYWQSSCWSLHNTCASSAFSFAQPYFSGCITKSDPWAWDRISEIIGICMTLRLCGICRKCRTSTPRPSLRWSLRPLRVLLLSGVCLGPCCLHASGFCVNSKATRSMMWRSKSYAFDNGRFAMFCQDIAKTMEMAGSLALERIPQTLCTPAFLPIPFSEFILRGILTWGTTHWVRLWVSELSLLVSVTWNLSELSFCRGLTFYPFADQLPIWSSTLRGAACSKCCQICLARTWEAQQSFAHLASFAANELA